MAEIKNYYFSSESVTEGHPDKICDAVSDAVLDECLKQDPNSRVACETLAKTGMILIAGEITTKARLDYQKIARDTVRRIGYTSSEMGFDADTCAVMEAIAEQSPDIDMGVSAGKGLFNSESSNVSEGAGDQGIMFGYAINETETFMPLTIHLAHRLAERLAKVRKEKIVDYLRPDGKSQVTVEYKDGKAARIEAIVISTQHAAGVDHKQIEADIKKHVINEICPANMLDENTKYYINPTGLFVVGGPMGDCGLTGRKIIVDSYGGHGAHGGGAFSGKDPTKVDRSACYMARYVAKNIAASGIADRALVQFAYAIGVPEPLSVYVNTFGTAKVHDEVLANIVSKELDLTPAGIIKKLDLRRPIYEKTTAYGHFGRELPEFTWEKTDIKDLFANAK
ncbi:methionine adenosyltransferase [uncultured Brachyspira sp.]|uniref:methionine adenosyltransferase n=1 Tax=uncultured Brachyspira sp. TaxID=221953 RepID=UPI00260D1BDF|nr:methionine adenosyltransferase [uncultured Brachyspira sp.]